MSRGTPRRRYADLDLYRRILAQARPYWPHIGTMFVLSLLATPIALLTPLPLKIAVDSVIGSEPLPGFLSAIVPASLEAAGGATLIVAVVLLVVVALTEQLHKLADLVLGTYTGERLQLEFRARLFRHAQRLSLAYHDTRGAGDAIYRIQYDAPSIQWIAVYGVTPFVTAGFTLLGMLVVMAMIDWQLALVALVVVPVLGVLTAVVRRRLRGGWTRTRELESSALSVVHEVLTSLRVVKAFSQEDREQARFTSASTAGMRSLIRLTAVEGVFTLLIALTISFGSAAVLLIGVKHVQAGTLTLGSLLLVMTYLLQIYGPLGTITSTLATLQFSLAGAERAFAVLDEVPEVSERDDALTVRRARGHVAFERVSFAYPDNPPVLHDVSFEIMPGTRLGISGTTGAGKTTLVSLLMRLYDPTAGRILLDGVDLRDLRLDDLRNQFAIVLQEPVLFSTTVAENIAYGRPGAAQADIAAAAKAANAHDFISQLPGGYDTMVGERGMRLSGGERQRISLARAFLKDAPVLVLDEPTSSVDSRTEASIMEAMDRLMEGRTTFLIAHRLSTLDYCDARLELAHGRIRTFRRDVAPSRHARRDAGAAVPAGRDQSAA